MHIDLTRFGSVPGHGTPGQAILNGQSCYSLEREWLDNKRDVSCIPAGTYTLVPHDSHDHPGSWALVNHDLGVSHYATPGIPRDLVLIHSANWQSELKGCIALGRDLAAGYDKHTRDDKLMVMQSVATITQMLGQLDRTENHSITIQWAHYES